MKTKENARRKMFSGLLRFGPRRGRKAGSQPSGAFQGECGPGAVRGDYLFIIHSFLILAFCFWGVKQKVRVNRGVISATDITEAPPLARIIHEPAR
jgi:hypothetical protein